LDEVIERCFGDHVNHAHLVLQLALNDHQLRRKNRVIFVANARFNNFGHPLYLTTINCGRHTLGTWPFVGAGWSGPSGALIGQATGQSAYLTGQL
jgi:hypothetical protein